MSVEGNCRKEQSEWRSTGEFREGKEIAERRTIVTKRTIVTAEELKKFEVLYKDPETKKILEQVAFDESVSMRSVFEQAKKKDAL